MESRRGTGAISKKARRRRTDPFSPDITVVTDEDGNEHTFEIVDRYETEENTYYALSPLFEDKAEYLRYDGSLILVRADEDEDGSYLDPIDDPAEYEAVYAAFEARLREAENEEEDGAF